MILLQDVEKLGLRGEVVNVTRGHMRNFLQPRKLAEIATPARARELHRREDQRTRHEARNREQAESIAATLNQTVLRFEVRAGPQGTLFGSVTPTDITDEIWRTRRVRVDRRKIDLDEPIKRVGRYSIPIEIFRDVSVEVQTLVVPEGGELPPEAEEPEAEPASESSETPEAAADQGHPTAGVEAETGETSTEDEAETKSEPEPA